MFHMEAVVMNRAEQNKCVDCGRERTLSYDTKQCHECEQADRERAEYFLALAYYTDEVC